MEGAILKRLDSLESGQQSLEAGQRSLEATQNRVINKLVSLEERVTNIEETMSTKSDIDRLFSVQDEILKILRRIDDERVMTSLTLKRHDERITTLEEAIS